MQAVLAWMAGLANLAGQQQGLRDSLKYTQHANAIASDVWAGSTWVAAQQMDQARIHSISILMGMQAVQLAVHWLSPRMCHAHADWQA